MTIEYILEELFTKKILLFKIIEQIQLFNIIVGILKFNINYST